ncbi:MAG TPA: hypothetical protein VFR49_00880, partial [Solirubrobacteraceae bacterium]|nr:hypothetical protein [Solirubrobacteraceae bacterium]
QTTAETIATDANGSYASVTPTTLNASEPSILIAAGTGKDAYISAATGGPTSYSVTATSQPTGNTYTIARATDGSTSRTCTVAAGQATSGGCTGGVAGGAAGTW